MAKSQVPSKRDDDNKVAAMTARDAELKAEKRRLESDLDSIENGFASVRSRSALDKAAHELLADGNSSLAGLTELSQQLDAVQTKVRIVERAIELNGKQLAEAQAAASRRLTESRRPGYAGIVREIKKAVDALQTALANEAEFRDRLLQDDCSIGNGVLYPMEMNIDYQLDSWLADAKQHYGI